jgi:putative phosphotransacetylase
MEKFSVLIECSARHVHVTKADMAVLFGEGSTLHPVRELSQPGQFLSEEKVRLEGPRGAMDRVSILGPERSATQVEISFTDARVLGATPPVRESGDVAGSSPIKIVGPNGSIEINEGVIVAKRHIHLTPEDAQKYGLHDKQLVSVKSEGPRSVTFHETVVRVSPKFATAMHVDVDEFNAAGLSGKPMGTVTAD